MRPLTLLFALALLAATRLPADQLLLLNGDRYHGKVIGLTADAVVLDSDILGKISLPRKQVASLLFGTNTVAPVTAPAANPTLPIPTNLPTAATLAQLARSLTNGTAATPQLRPLAAPNTNSTANPDLARQIREQMLTGSPEATAKYNEMVAGLMSGRLTVTDLQRQAKASADQIRELKQELGPDAGDALDGYLQILDSFVKEANPAPTTPAPANP